MALWEKTTKLSHEALKTVQHTYNIIHQFPIEVRHYFCTWIEEQPWKDIDVTNCAHEPYAKQLLTSLTTLLTQKAAESTDFMERLKFQDFAKQFDEVYSSNPLGLVKVMKACLGTEEQLVRAAESASDVTSTTMDLLKGGQAVNQIMKDIEELRRYTEQTEQELKDMQSKQEQFIIDYQNQLKISTKLQRTQQQPQSDTRDALVPRLQAQKVEMDRQLLAAAQQLLQCRILIANKHKECLNALGQLQKKVIDDELIKWKHRQQLAGNGADFDTSSIEALQKWCEALAELTWTTRKQIINVDLLRQQLPIELPAGVEDVQPELNQTVTKLLSTIVTSTFIVETQPPQVLKTNSKFTATVRLLVGGKLNLHMSPPRVKATIISEVQARALMTSGENTRHQESGQILNHEGSMEYNQHTGQLSITFRNMSLKNIKRADKKGTETVAEEKFCIFFTSQFDIGGNELNFQVWTLSLPVIVTVHTQQECQATATYLWDNQFSKPVRVPFQVPESVPWPELAMMLTTKFKAMTGRGLSESNLEYLASKLLSGPLPDGDQTMITWSQFNKENMPRRNFTFWDWFYAVAKLVKEQLKCFWTDGSIIGFMDKTAPQEKLMSKPNGTFLMRFSDGTLGGLTIAWVSDVAENADERTVWNLAPFTSKDFTIRGLADRVKDLTTLVALYPEIPKDAAFSKYYSPPVTENTQGVNQEGYVPYHLVNVIPSTQAAGAVNYNAGLASPASPAQSSYSQNMDNAMDIIQEETDMAQELDYNAYDHLNLWLTQASERESGLL